MSRNKLQVNFEEQILRQKIKLNLCHDKNIFTTTRLLTFIDLITHKHYKNKHELIKYLITSRLFTLQEYFNMKSWHLS